MTRKVRMVQDSHSGEIRIEQFSYLYGGSGVWTRLDELDLKGLVLPRKYPRYQLPQAKADFKKVQNILSSELIVLEEVEV